MAKDKKDDLIAAAETIGKVIDKLPPDMKAKVDVILVKATIVAMFRATGVTRTTGVAAIKEMAADIARWEAEDSEERSLDGPVAHQDDVNTAADEFLELMSKVPVGQA